MPFNPFNWKRPITLRRRVAVVGLLRSGKTVLLTSLISHFKHHKPATLPIGGNGQPVKLVEIGERTPASGFPAFQFREHRNRLSSQSWPSKTHDVSEYRAEFARSDWTKTKIDLSLLDMPGERLADLLIAASPDFGTWSDHVLRMFEECPEFFEQTREYFELHKTLEGTGQTSVDAEQLVGTYRRVMARLICTFMPVVTPSTFLIPPNGEPVPSQILQADQQARIEELAQTRHSGLSASEQFAPLPLSLRQRFPEITRAFGKFYRRYRLEFVQKFAKALKQADDLVVLVDVAGLLEGGDGMFNANVELLKTLLSFINPGCTLRGKLFRIASLGHWQWDRVRRVTFVATKSDRVLPDDVDRLEDLLREMVEPTVDGLQANGPPFEVEYLTCAAIKSAKPHGDPATQLEFDAHDDQTNSIKCHIGEVPRIPESWPANWEPGEYRFPKPLPRMPTSRIAVPNHYGLEQIAELILGQ